MALYHSAKGSVNYTVVGNPTIVDGVVSGFSANNRIEINSFPATAPWKIVIPYKYAGGTGTQNILGNADTFIIKTYNSGLYLSLKESGSTGWDINESAGLSLTNGAWTYISLEFTGTMYKYSYSTDGVSFTLLKQYTLGNVVSNKKILFGAFSSSVATGSIDLNHTYITVNGQPWFGICPIEVQKHQLMGPVGYTISGEGATVTDGILTGVTSSASCLTTQTIPDFNTFEFVTKAKTSTSNLFLVSFAGVNSSRRISAGSNYLGFWNGGSDFVVAFESTPEIGQLFANGIYVKLYAEKNNDTYNYTLSYSADKVTWSSLQGTSSTGLAGGYVSLLRNSSGASRYMQMDLNETYIKVNGKLWFWQPQPTKKIYVNNVLVWEKSA